MNRRKYKYNKKSSRFKEFITSHLENNIKEYAIISIIFLIGIIVGVIFINNVSENQSLEINQYISSFIENIKGNKEINELALLKDSISKNFVLAIFLWFMGSTVIGISIVYITICFRGFCLGYTISSIIFSYGIRERSFYIVSYDFSTKFDIYSMHYSTCSEWNEVT